MATTLIDLTTGLPYIFNENLVVCGQNSISGATNGLTSSATMIELGGTLNHSTTINANNQDFSICCGSSINMEVYNVASGYTSLNINNNTTFSSDSCRPLSYGDDYSINYDNRSLVDQGYVKNLTDCLYCFCGIGGTIVTTSGHSISIYSVPPSGTTVQFTDVLGNATSNVSLKSELDKKVNITTNSVYTGNTAILIGTKLNTTTYKNYTGMTGLQEITNVNAVTTRESTFKGGLIVNKIRPTGNTINAIQINKANGTTNVINIDTISGFTGFGTLAPKNKIHVYGSDVSNTSEFSVQTNGITLDGVAGADKEIVWANNGVPKWQAQTYRNENDVFWYLVNTQSQSNPLTVMETGRVGINKQTNNVNYHTVEVATVTGLDDLAISGIYTQNYDTVYEVEIVSSGVTYDTWHWRKSIDAGVTYTDYSPTSGATLTPTLLEHGISLNFEHLTGHGAGAKWRFAAYTQIPQATLSLAPMGIQEVVTTNDYTAGSVIYKDITGVVNGGLFGSQFEIFKTGTGGTKQAFYMGFTVQAQMIFFHLTTAGAGLTLVTEYWNTLTNEWIVLDGITHSYIDGTASLTKSGRIIWQSNLLTGWNKGYIPNLAESGYDLYWIRLRTTTNPSTAPIAKSVTIGNDKRFSVYESFNDYNPSFYIDSLSRVNIGGGTITGSNVFQINPSQGLSVASVAGGDSYAEIDSEDSSLSTLRLKVASNDSCGTSLEFGRTRGTLDTPLSMQTNDLIGRINFKGRVGNSGSVSSQISSQYVGDGSTTRCADLVFSTACGSCTAVAAERVRINYKGNTGFGISNPTAIIHIQSGNTTVSPLKFTNPPALVSSPQSGAVEFKGNHYYGTITGNTRNTFAFLESPIFTGIPQLPSGTTFFQGLATCSIRPLADSTTALHIHRADGITPIVNFDTISGFTGYGTIAPKALIHTYGLDNVEYSSWNYQSNAIRLDGALDTDKDVQWYDNGIPAFSAQIYRNESGRYWYLSSPQGHVNQITVSNTGRVGINNQTNIMAYHAILEAGGPNDLSVGGFYTQDYTSIYRIEINGVTGITNTFRWNKSINNGETFGSWSPTSGCSTGTTTLEHGVTFKFNSSIGHSLGTSWVFGAFAQLPMGTFVVTPNRFTEIQTTTNYTANTVTYVDVTGEGNSSTFGSSIRIFNTGLTSNAIYFGTLDKNNAVFVNISTVGQGITLLVEYYDGTGPTGWHNLTVNNNSYSDGTSNLTQSGDISWETSTMTEWVPAYLPDLDKHDFQLYWIRVRTSTNPSASPIANSFARGGTYRIAVLSSPSDFKPSFYVDSLGRTNIGGGNVTGCNRFQINSAAHLSESATPSRSVFEVDSQCGCVADMKIKLSSNDTCGGGFTFFKSRGCLDVPTGVVTGDVLGRVDFRGRVGVLGQYLSQITSQYVGDGTTRRADLIFSTANGSTPVERLRLNYNGNTGFGVSNPSAFIHITSGTTTVGPLKFNNPPALVSSPQSGNFEFKGNHYYGTTTGNTRNTFAFLESPVFTGNVSLPTTTCLNNTSLCTYILQSGGTNNNTLNKTCIFNTYTGNTQPIINTAITGATNGLTKYNSRNVCLGGTLTSPLIITGTQDICLKGGRVDIASSCGAQIWDKNGCGIELYSSGGTTTIKSMTITGAEAMRLQLSNTHATYTDSRVLARGLEYNADYSNTYSARSLVDKNYVDTHAGGIFPKTAVSVATTTNLAHLTGLTTTIDGIILTNGMRVLVKNQVSGQTNGVYVATGTTWTRATDFDQTAEVVNGSYFLVLTGSTGKNNSWILTNPNPISVGVDALTFVLFTASNGVTAGNGITVTQVGGNYNVATNLTASCGLCSEVSGLRVNPNIAGTGLNYSSGVLSVCGSNLAGNSILWSANTFNVNVNSGGLYTALSGKASVASLNTYTGTTAPNKYETILNFNSYTGVTSSVLNSKASIASLSTYTGTTAPNTYVNASNFNSYTGATRTILNGKAFLSGATFTGVIRGNTPAVNDSSTCFATTAYFLGQCGTATPLMDGSGNAGTSTLWTKQDHVHPSDTSRLATSVYQTYTGTTVPNTYVKISSINTFTGTTLPNNYVNKSAYVLYTGTTVPTTYATNARVSTKASLSGATFTGVISVCKPAQNDNTNCVATTSWYISQAGTASPLMNNGVCIGTSNLFSREDHVHASDTSRVIKAGDTMTGALKINSALTVTGSTRLSGSTYISTLGSADITTDHALFQNPTTKQITSYKLTGGSDSYFYVDRTTPATSSAGGLVMYLSGTPWNFKSGRYTIDFDSQFGNTTANGITCLLFAVDGTVIGTCYQGGGQVNNWVNTASLSRDVTFAAGCHCLTIQFARGGNTSCVCYGMIRAKRIC